MAKRKSWREKLAEWRRSLPGETTLEAAGNLLGVSAAQISRYENGSRDIAPERCAEVERVTGIPRSELRPDIFDPAPARAAE